MGLTQVDHFCLTIDSRPDLRLHDDCPYPMSPFAVIQALFPVLPVSSNASGERLIQSARTLATVRAVTMLAALSG